MKAKFLLIIIISSFLFCIQLESPKNLFCREKGKLNGLIIIGSIKSTNDYYLVNLNSEEKINLTKDIEYYFELVDAKISFDQKKIAVIIRSRHRHFPYICIMDLDGSDKKYLYKHSNYEKIDDYRFDELEWIPNNENILILAKKNDQENVFLLDLKTLEMKQLTFFEKEIDYYLKNLRVSTDGKTAYFMYKRPCSKTSKSIRAWIYAVNIKNGDVKKITGENDDVWRFDVITSETKILAALIRNYWENCTKKDFDMRLYKIDNVNGSMEEVMDYPFSEFFAHPRICVSPDGKSLAGVGSNAKSFLFVFLEDQSKIKKRIIFKGYKDVFDWH